MRHNDDRISLLPNDVLCHILSFLPTVYSIRTRVLSSRWTYLFAYVPTLDFDFRLIPFTGKNCIDFVNKVFMMYAVSQMSKFRIHNYTSCINIESLRFWISSAICRNVRELDICMYDGRDKALPGEIFYSRVLSSIKVQGGFVLQLPRSACLPSLRILHLRHVCFSSSGKRILSVCPELDDFMLEECYTNEKDGFDISHPNLKKLWVEYCYFGDNLVVNAPSLLYFDYLSFLTMKNIGESVLTSLVKARICHLSETCSVNFLSQLFSVVSHVRHLYLSRASIEVGEVSKVVLGLLPDLFIRSRHLKVLVFDKGFTDEEPDDTELPLCYENVPACVSSQLKEIEFRAFSMQETECKLVKYFLKNAEVLDKIRIQSSVSWERQFEFSKKLLTFPKFSMNCQIILDSDCAAEE